MMDFLFMIIQGIQGRTYSPTCFTAKTILIMHLINVAKNDVFLFVAIIANTTEPSFAQVSHTAYHHCVYINISFCLCLQQDI